MHKVLKKTKLAENTFQIDIDAREICQKAKPGQFVIARIDEQAERIPLTIADSTSRALSLVILNTGHSSERLSNLKKSDIIQDLIGPLGNPSKIEKFGNVCLVGGGLGIAPIYPIAKAMKNAGNRVITIIGTKSKKHLFWEDRFKQVSDKVYITTDDGSKGIRGFVTKALEQSVKKDHLNRIVCIGPVPMMKAVSEFSRHRVKTIVSLNPIMIDGIGMCGSCRVCVNGETKFACVDGPEFDGHEVDFDSLWNRNARYDDINHKRCH